MTKWKYHGSTLSYSAMAIKHPEVFYFMILFDNY